jgi:hypothetical protein
MAAPASTCSANESSWLPDRGRIDHEMWVRTRTHALTRNLALELAPHQIRVNAVAPAVAATPIYERFVPKDQLEATLHSGAEYRPAG